MNNPQPASPRKRMLELQAIPDRQRTDAEWDELNELEIALAPGNRIGAKEPVGNNPNSRPNGPPRGRGVRAGGSRPGPGGNAGQGGGNGVNSQVATAEAGGSGNGDAGNAKRPFKKFRKRSGKGQGQAQGAPKPEGSEG